MTSSLILMVLQRWLYDLKKPKAVALVKWLTKKSVEKIQDEHQQVIKEKDATLALLNDDLKNCEYENVALQVQRDVYQSQL